MLLFLVLNLLFQSEVLEYELYWAGIEAGKLTLKYEEFNETIEIKMLSQTTGIVKTFYYMDDEIFSIVRKSDFQTLYYKKNIKEKKKQREEISIFFPEEKVYFYKYIRFFDFFNTDSLSVFFLLRFKKSYENPIKVYERGKFYNVFIKEEKEYKFQYKGRNFLTNKITLNRKDKENSNIVIYFLNNKEKIPISIEFSFALGTLKAILKCY